MKNIEPFLNFKGNCEQAFNFYSGVFDKKLSNLYRYKDFQESGFFSDSESELICHVGLDLSETLCLHGSDLTNEQAYVKGKNISICININTNEEAQKLYTQLSEGGKIIAPLQKTNWAELYAYFTDKFGVDWIINYLASNNQNLEPYIRFDGNCEQAFDFYSNVFATKAPQIYRLKDLPDTNNIPEPALNNVYHAILPLCDSTNLLGTDNLPDFENIIGNNVAITINTESILEAKTIYDKLSTNGEIIMPLAQTEWSEAFAWLTDKFGVCWIIDVVANN